MTTERNSVPWMVAPMLLLLGLVFVGPLLWFFTMSFGELFRNGLPQGLDYAAKALSSRSAIQAFATTLRISFVVTLLCLIFSYPLAYFLTRAGKLAFNLVLLCVVVPYFTSVIVRTYAWMALLGGKGLVNDALITLGLTKAPLEMLYNEKGILIGMTYVLVPYTVLTLYAAMTTIDARLMQAARGMGASNLRAFWTVYFPLSMPGVVSGGLIVFILSLGYFITPALMGGPKNVLIATKIQHEVEIMLNWPLAAVLSLALLAVTLILFTIYIRFGGLKSLYGSGQ